MGMSGSACTLITDGTALNTLTAARLTVRPRARGNAR